MRKLNLFFLIVFCMFLLSCTKIIKLNSDFNTSEVNWFNKKGNNTISGQAFLRTRGGDIKTCAGYEVFLIPVSTYSEERIFYLYGNITRGFRNVNSQHIKFVPGNPEYHKFIKKTVCDASGNFEFKNVPDGEYFLITRVIWEAPGYGDYLIKQGGFLMKRVRIKNGQIKKIILTY